MRISDWSSDVCSSDLLVVAFFLATVKISFDQFIARPIHPLSAIDGAKITPFPCEFLIFHDSPFERIPVNLLSGRASIRSEEHTSELQSLMRISYAVFCLKKKTTKKHPAMRTNQKQQNSTQPLLSHTN